MDEPGVRPRRRPADRTRRPARARRRVPRGDGRGQAAVRAGAGRGAGRHPAVLVAGGRDVGDPPGRPAAAGRPRGAAGQRDHLQRARPAPAAVPRAAPSSSSTSRCRRSPRAWASTSPCTATSTSSTFGLISCRELVPDLWDMVDLHIDEIDVLFEATGAEWAVPPRPAPPRHGTGARHAARKPAAKKAARQAGAAPAVGEEGAAGRAHADRPQERQGVRRQARARGAQRRAKQAPTGPGVRFRRRSTATAGPEASQNRSRLGEGASTGPSRPAPASRRTRLGPPWRPPT